MSHDPKPIDGIIWGLAAVATGLTLAKVALLATILAGLGSFAVAMIRVYVFFKTGRSQ